MHIFFCCFPSLSAATLVSVNIYLRSISKIEDSKMVSLVTSSVSITYSHSDRIVCYCTYYTAWCLVFCGLILAFQCWFSGSLQLALLSALSSDRNRS